MDKVILGSEIKISITLDVIDGYDMDYYDFNITLYTACRNNIVTAQKIGKYPNCELINLVRKEANTYVVLVDTKLLGVGRIYGSIDAKIPDEDFADGFRNEVAKFLSDIVVV